MTAPDPRVGEIETRAARAAEWPVRNITDEDRTYLLAELRKAHEALERVEAVAGDLATRGAAIEAKGYNGSIYSNRNEGRSIGYLEGARLIRAAVSAAKGDGRG
ncbi:hypothetical protein [Pseudarthrobacter sp. NIBRBAC000502771]|uniref:hypothetical protein n=1 Tax=Pseudarthrobacter sp. NIBRBAC000502771 TaxID=2590774 RepID=UPI00113261CD|nr:hypothetical protein [Pseudarthrobacter sp. NIBRBAC000502771]QDG61224.1 hypothetical protein NIBR502771_02145 [Pseudarthrobacter sp. NIBRBAC000502771]